VENSVTDVDEILRHLGILTKPLDERVRVWRHIIDIEMRPDGLELLVCDCEFLFWHIDDSGPCRFDFVLADRETVFTRRDDERCRSNVIEAIFVNIWLVAQLVQTHPC